MTDWWFRMRASFWKYGTLKSSGLSVCSLFFVAIVGASLIFGHTHMIPYVDCPATCGKNLSNWRVLLFQRLEPPDDSTRPSTTYIYIFIHAHTHWLYIYIYIIHMCIYVYYRGAMVKHGEIAASSQGTGLNGMLFSNGIMRGHLQELFHSNPHQKMRKTQSLPKRRIFFRNIHSRIYIYSIW